MFFFTIFVSLKTLSVEGMCRKTDNLQEPTDNLASKLINNIRETTERIIFDAKLSVGSFKLSLLRHMSSTFNVFSETKIVKNSSYEKTASDFVILQA